MFLLILCLLPVLFSETGLLKFHIRIVGLPFVPCSSVNFYLTYVKAILLGIKAHGYFILLANYFLAIMKHLLLPSVAFHVNSVSDVTIL